MIVFAGFVFYAPNILGHSDNYIQADPLNTGAHCTRMVSITILCNFKSVPDKLGGVILMFSAILILALPWLDTSKVRSAVFDQFINSFFGYCLDVLV